MQRLSYLNHSLSPASSLLASKLRTRLLDRKKQIIHALQPKLSFIVKRIISQKYARILQRVELARQRIQRKGFSLKNTANQQFFRDCAQVTRFEKSVSESFETIMPEIFNEIAQFLSLQLGNASQGNLLASAIKFYNSVKGSYQHKFSCKELLTPTIRTLHKMQRAISSQVTDTDTDKFYTLLYLFFFIFVHVFGKYITPPEKRVVESLIWEGFLVSVVEVATSMRVEGVNQSQIEGSISRWVGQLAKLLK